jgi:DNA-binding NarL/FixJ family response regulator
MGSTSTRHGAETSGTRQRSRQRGRHPQRAMKRDHRTRATPLEVAKAEQPIRIVVADHHQMFAQGLRAMLSSQYEVVAVVRDGADVVNTVATLKPDLLLLSISLPSQTGLDVLRDLQSLDTSVRVVVVTMHLDRALADIAIRLGASAFVPKEADVAELRKAIEEVLAGRLYISPLLHEHGSEGAAPSRPGFSRLTPRQQDIVRLIGQGLPTEDIARKLGISVHTVSFHRKNIRQQLGCDSVWAVLRFAILADLSEETRCVLGGRPACIDAVDAGVALAGLS